MGKAVAALCLLAAAGLALAGCSGDTKKSEDDPNVFPKDYEREIYVTMTSTLDDPTKVRDAGISEPVLRPAGREPRYSVCVRSNSRDGARHYEGIKERIAYFYGGHLNQLIDADKSQCAGAVYKPWPDLEKYCLAKICS